MNKIDKVYKSYCKLWNDLVKNTMLEKAIPKYTKLEYQKMLKKMNKDRLID